MPDAPRSTEARSVSTLTGLTDRLVELGLASAVVTLVGHRDRIVWAGSAGRVGGRRGERPDLDSLFDLASLTKPFMATLALRLDQLQHLALDLALGAIWPQAPAHLKTLPLEALLRHQAGFRAWAPLYQVCKDPTKVESYLLRPEVSRSPRDLYSDLGYILWGLAAERLLGSDLRALVGTYLLPILPLEAVVPGTTTSGRAVVCSLDGRREVELGQELGVPVRRLPPPQPGQVQDGNARFFGGVAAHAGLFGSAHALWWLGRQWLGQPGPLDNSRLQQALSGSGPYALGWVRAQASESSGPALGSASVGHTGFTGCSLWLDPHAHRVFALLAHRTSVDVELAPWRRRFHRLALEV